MAGAATEGTWWQGWLCQVETLLPPRSAGVERGSHGARLSLQSPTQSREGE